MTKTRPIHTHNNHPPAFHYSFRDFIDSGGDESTSPFLKPHARALTRWLHLPLALGSSLLLLLAWGFELAGLNQGWVLSLIACVYFLSGTRAAYLALRDLLNLEVNIDVLMTLSAYLCIFTGSPLEGALLLVLFDISRNLEHQVTLKARSSLMALRSSAPEKAWLLVTPSSPARLSDPQQQRHIQDIGVGSYLVVKAGELVPLDGVIVEGSSSVTLSHLTGEPLPVRMGPGQEVPSGARALESPLLIQVTRPASESTLTRIIRLVYEAQEARPQLQRLFDQLADRYAKVVICLTALIAALLPWLSQMPYLGQQGSIYRALGFMIAASPCALILAVPIAYLSSLSACARRGIVLKGSAALDRLALCKQLALDKTGTLTFGTPQLETLVGFGQYEGLEGAALAIESQAKHPLAQSLVEYLAPRTQPQEVTDIQLHAGFGMSAKFSDQLVRVGSSQWAVESFEGAWKKALIDHARQIQQRGLAHAVIASPEGGLVATFSDQLRPQVSQTIDQLRQVGLSTCMLTGDHEQSARSIAQACGIEQVHHSLKPEDKLMWIEQLRQQAPLAMVGDGINDAPALAGATVGIAMGLAGSAAATAVADVLLLHDEIELLPWLFRQAKATQRVIWQNLILAASLIVIAASCALLGSIPLWAAVIAHEGGTIIVALNGLRLMRQGPFP